MTRTGQDAINYARGRVGNGPPPPHGMEASGYCLAFVRECFAVGSRYASAIEAWNASAYPHPGDRNPPAGVPMYFLSPSVYDHVTFGGDPGVEIITTFNDDVRRYTGSNVIQQIERDFDGSYLGWAEDINGVRVWSGSPSPTPEPEPPVEEPVWHLYIVNETGKVYFGGPGEWKLVTNGNALGVLEDVYGPRIPINVNVAQTLNDTFDPGYDPESVLED